MKLSEVTQVLENISEINFRLPDQTFIPKHFHITEVGKITKHFIDCGGQIRKEERLNFQLYLDIDVDHRLQPQKLIKIIQLSKNTLALPDLEVEVEYQGVTIQKFDLGFDGSSFVLLSKQTDCLAKDKCGIPQPEPKKRKVQLKQLACCDPNTNCC